MKFVVVFDFSQVVVVFLGINMDLDHEYGAKITQFSGNLAQWQYVPINPSSHCKWVSALRYLWKRLFMTGKHRMQIIVGIYKD